MNSNQKFTFDSIVSSFLDDLDTKLHSTNITQYTVLDFVKYELDLGIELTTQQQLILKTIYGLPLTDIDKSILDYWCLERKCSYKPDYEHQSVVLGLGRRGSKTLLSSIIVAYEFYRLCKLDNPQSYYNISKTSWISILVLATTATQSKDTIFGSVIGVFQNCPYFKRLEAQNKLFIGKEYITYEDKLITIKSGNSKSSSQVGGNLICLVMDEFALFTSDDGQSNAMALWSALGISLSPFGFKGKRLAISSADHDGDAIEELLALSQDDPTSFTLEACSWEINPQVHPSTNPIVASEYQLNPKLAALHYENIRSSLENAYFDTHEVERAFVGKTTISYKQEYTYISNDKLVQIVIDSINRDNSGRQNFLHIDASISSDSYALVYGQVDNTHTYLSIDGIITWRPEKDAPVFFENVYDAIVKIHSQRPLYLVSSDHYAASAQTMQSIKQFGIRTRVINYTNNQQLLMYKALKSLLREARISFPSNCINQPLLYKELTQLLLIQKGNNLKLNHPPRGSKDIADCIAAISWLAIDENILRASVTNTSLIQSTGYSNLSPKHNQFSVYNNSHPSKTKLNSLNSWRTKFKKNIL